MNTSDTLSGIGKSYMNNIIFPHFMRGVFYMVEKVYNFFRGENELNEQI